MPSPPGGGLCPHGRPAGPAGRGPAGRGSWHPPADYLPRVAAV